jgi:hypothetical protein
VVPEGRSYSQRIGVNIVDLDIDPFFPVDEFVFWIFEVFGVNIPV